MFKPFFSGYTGKFAFTNCLNGYVKRRHCLGMFKGPKEVPAWKLKNCLKINYLAYVRSPTEKIIVPLPLYPFITEDMDV